MSWGVVDAFATDDFSSGLHYASTVFLCRTDVCLRFRPSFFIAFPPASSSPSSAGAFVGPLSYVCVCPGGHPPGRFPKKAWDGAGRPYREERWHHEGDLREKYSFFCVVGGHLFRVSYSQRAGLCENRKNVCCRPELSGWESMWHSLFRLGYHRDCRAMSSSTGMPPNEVSAVPGRTLTPALCVSPPTSAHADRQPRHPSIVHVLAPIFVGATHEIGWGGCFLPRRYTRRREAYLSQKTVFMCRNFFPE